MASESDAGKQRISPTPEINPCHLASPRRHQRIIPGRSSDLQDRPTRRTSQAYAQCLIRLSYLLTAAGQSRFLTGFPFHPLLGGTKNLTTISRPHFGCNTINCGYLADSVCKVDLIIRLSPAERSEMPVKPQIGLTLTNKITSSCRSVSSIELK